MPCIKIPPLQSQESTGTTVLFETAVGREEAEKILPSVIINLFPLIPLQTAEEWKI
jgi:hypothetical protein